jgi:hypothetical protein
MSVKGSLIGHDIVHLGEEPFTHEEPVVTRTIVEAPKDEYHFHWLLKHVRGL